MKRLFLSVCCLVTLSGVVGCQSDKKQGQTEFESLVNTSTDLSEECDSANHFCGTFQGTFPCADCPGKDVSLSIMDDGTYHLEYEYLETGEGVIEENGVYNLLDNSVIETVTPSSGDKTYYVYVHGNLVLSDSLGNVNKGELADMYKLKRQK